MYEMKKVAAQKTIEKKQSKVEEINKLLADEITPTLEKLRKERTAYQQWVHNNTEIEARAVRCEAIIASSTANISNHACILIENQKKKSPFFGEEIMCKSVSNDPFCTAHCSLHLTSGLRSDWRASASRTSFFSSSRQWRPPPRARARRSRCACVQHISSGDRFKFAYSV